ncbi:hypothetical protein PENTCL1PPCAC_19201, partial [Pristionchus entomophagus]
DQSRSLGKGEETEKKDERGLLDQELHRAKHHVVAMLKIHIAYLFGVIKNRKQRGVPLSDEERMAINRFVRNANEFEQKQQTVNTMESEARFVLNQLDTLERFGYKKTEGECAVEQKTLKHIEIIKEKYDVYEMNVELERLRRTRIVEEAVQKAVGTEFTTLKEQLKREPAKNVTEKRVRIFISILKMHISAIRGTMHESETAEKKAAVDDFERITNEFNPNEHREETFLQAANSFMHTAQQKMRKTYKVLGDIYKEVKDTVSRASRDPKPWIVSPIKEGREPLHNDQVKSERLEKKHEMEKEDRLILHEKEFVRLEKDQKKEMERKEIEKMMKKKEKRNKYLKNRKSASNNTNDDLEKKVREKMEKDQKNEVERKGKEEKNDQKNEIERMGKEEKEGNKKESVSTTTDDDFGEERGTVNDWVMGKNRSFRSTEHKDSRRTMGEVSRVSSYSVHFPIMENEQWTKFCSSNENDSK